MNDKTENLNKTTASIILIVIILAIIAGGYFLLQNKNADQNISNNQNVNKEQKFDVKNGFYVSAPSNWILTDSSTREINIVKFGSPVQYTYFELKDGGNEIFGPYLGVETFTIDKRLSAKDVTNLIQDEKIADKIQQGTKECLFNPQEFTVAGFNAFAFIHNTTDLSKCTEDVTEPAITKTVVIKKQGNQNTMIISYTAVNNNEYQKYLADLQYLVDSVEYRDTQI